MTALHSALKTTVLNDHTAHGIHYKLIRLQNGKDNFTDTLHARPNTWSSSGIQNTDFLSLIGFRRSACEFHYSECFCMAVPQDLDVTGLSNAIQKSLVSFQKAASHLENCGLFVAQPEGWGFFYSKPANRRMPSVSHCRGNGHTASKIERMKESQDEFFHFVFTWIEGGSDKGWTTHYRAKHMPLTNEFQSVIDFLGGFKWFSDCPEYDFEGCWWRFTPFESNGNQMFGSNVEVAHRWFDGHAAHFAEGIKGLLDAHATLEPWGMSFLSKAAKAITAKAPILKSPIQKALPVTTKTTTSDYRYDVAFSFAGTERTLVEEIATILKDNGFNVFYDDFYPEQLWGKDLAATFDRIYRKESRYCVMFLSQEYADRMWTTHERRSATARALQEKGNEYILPVRVDDVDIDGLAPTLGYVSAASYSAKEIADLLMSKLKG